MIQKVGFNTRVQRQNTTNSKPQNFGMAFPKEEVIAAVARRDCNALNGYVRAIEWDHYHKSKDEAAEGAKFLTEKAKKAQEANDKNGYHFWNGLKDAFDYQSAKHKFVFDFA